MTLASALTATTWSWSIPQSLAPGATYKVRVRADDGRGGLAVDQSDAVFEVAGAAIASPTWSDANAILTSSCSGSTCHSGRGGQNAYVGDEALVTANKAAIEDQLAAGTMPKSKTMPSADKQTLLNYLRSL
jgi:hypothetical protein